MSKRKAIDALGIGPGVGPDGVGARFYVFGLGTDNKMYCKYWDGNTWHPSQSGWEALGGVFVSPPAVALRSATSFDIAALGTDNHMYHKYWDGNTWHPSQTGWEALGGVFVSAPAIAGFQSTNPLDIFGFGIDNQMYHKYWDGSAWHPSQTGWEGLGGLFVSPPSVGGLDTQDLKLNIVCDGTDNHMYHKYWDGSAWHPSQSGWEALGGTFVSAPASAGTTSDTQFNTAGVGADNQIYYKYFANSTGEWFPSQAGWEALGGVFVSQPAIVESGVPLNTVDVFALGTDNQVYHRSKSLFGPWQPAWEALGGVFTSAPATDWVSLADNDSAVHVVAIGTDNAIYHKYFDGTTWHPSKTGWESLGGRFTIP
jgi:hypothetical protein